MPSKLAIALRVALDHGADLSYAYLSYANLRGADLSDANLSYADLRGAKGYVAPMEAEPPAQPQEGGA